MDDSLQIVIYIVFLAIYFLTRFLKGNKQRQARPRRDVEPEQDADRPDQPMTFEDILKELTQPKEKPAKPSPARVAPAQPMKHEYDFKSDYPDDDEIQQVYEESQRKAKSMKTLNEVVELGEGSIKFKEYQESREENVMASEIRDMLRNSHDARKAIILKEILDRKF